MARLSFATAIVVALIMGIPGRALVSAQETSDLAGRWMLDREHSQFPQEIGFGADVASSSGLGSTSAGSAGRGRRGSSSRTSNPAMALPESEDDVERKQQLTAEVRTPPASLTIAETATAVTVTDDRGRSRTLRPNGREDVLQLDGVPVATTTKWVVGRLIVDYQVSQGRALRYTYSRNVDPPQLIVDVQFVERDGHDSVRRIYTPASAIQTLPAAAASAEPAPVTSGPGSSPPPSRSALRTAGSQPPADRVPPATVALQPDAELKGLSKLGLVVEDLSPQAVACGLNQGAIETAVSKSLSDAGLTVLRRSDDDTYIYVNIVTSSVSSGLCVSRYDVFLYSYTTAALSYHAAPALVQVSLLHQGGMAGGAPAAHGEDVLRGVTGYVDQFTARIRAANR